MQILAPIIRGRKGQFKEILQNLKREGFVRIRVDGKLKDLSEKIILDKNKKHDIEVVIDRIIIDEDIKERITDSIELGLKMGSGLIIVNILPKKEHLYSENFSCPKCDLSIEEISPRMFSFNCQYGAVLQIKKI